MQTMITTMITTMIMTKWTLVKILKTVCSFDLPCLSLYTMRRIPKKNFKKFQKKISKNFKTIFLKKSQHLRVPLRYWNAICCSSLSSKRKSNWNKSGISMLWVDYWQLLDCNIIWLLQRYCSFWDWKPLQERDIIQAAGVYR